MANKYISVEAAKDLAVSYIEDDELCAKACEDFNGLPAADVVSKADYDELLKAARAMHTWIFLHSCDELEAYDECKLTPEMNALLGYAGSFEVRGEDNG